MASTFPGAIDNFTDPLAGSALNSPSHSAQHADLNSAVNRIETYMGLVKVVPTSVAGSGVSLSSVGTVTFSAASTASINGCFSALYQNYKIEISITTSNQTTLQYRFRTAGSDNSTANYANQYLVVDSTTVVGGRSSAQTIGDLGQMVLTDLSFFDITVYSPFDTAKTGMLVQNGSVVGEAYMRNQVNAMKASTSFDGITLIPTAGTITGTARVYGYRN
jgi:hypothetical protein